MDLRQPTAASPAEAAADAIAKIRQLAIFPALPDEQSGAPFFADLAALKQESQPYREVRENLIGAAIAAVEVCWASAEDELAALESDLRRRPHAVWSPLMLARAVHEAVIFIGYVAEPSLSLEERLFRIGNTWLEDANNYVNASPLTHPSGVNYRGTLSRAATSSSTSCARVASRSVYRTRAFQHR